MIQIDESSTNTNEQRTSFIVEQNIQPIYRLGAHGQTHARATTCYVLVAGQAWLVRKQASAQSIHSQLPARGQRER